MEKKGELEETNFQIFRIEYAIKQYRTRCELLGIDSEPKTDELLEQLSALIEKRNQLEKE